MVVIRTRTPRPLVMLGLGVVALAVAGCGGGDKAVSGFAGGTSSKDKAPIPSAVTASTTPSTSVEAAATGLNEAMPQIEGPAVAAKVADVGSTKDDKGPIREESNQYRANRQRDPFLSLIGTDTRDDLVDLSVVTLVGVVTSGDRPFAVVEDTEGVSYVLHKGDRVKNGRVVSVKRDALVCSQTLLGYTTTVQLKLESGKDVKNG
ncbi:MAG: hypothetical protein DHS20C21_14620 [Gemmatimonadota bacterium]|nr:MAG: hypothetical protein DHS20C21_14620 [Gemmatimonadota bacterium]